MRHKYEPRPSILQPKEKAIICGILFLILIIGILLMVKPFEHGRISVDEADLDVAVDAARYDYLEKNGIGAAISAGGKTFTYYFAANDSKLGIEISDTPQITAKSEKYQGRTIIVVIDERGNIDSAAWRPFPPETGTQELTPIAQ